MKKRIAVNTRFLIENKLEGIGWFTYQVLKRLVAERTDWEWHFLFDRPFSEEFIFGKNVTGHVLPPQARHPFLWYIWFEHSIPAKLNQLQPDLFFSTDGFTSLKSVYPDLLTIHDLAFEHFETHIDKLSLRFIKHYTPKYARKAGRICTVSEFSKQDICTRYGIPQERVDVVYNGASELYKPLDESEKSEIREAYTGGKPYFIYAGSIHPRKNVARLLEAYDQFRTTGGPEFKLLLAGRKAWKFKETMAVLGQMKFREDVILTGHVHPNELRRLIGAAHSMLYVSLFEGFGIPIVEAMQSGIPVITSDRSSTIEVASDAALLVNPEQTGEISAAMMKLTSDEKLYGDLVQKGLLRAADFSWDQTAAACGASMDAIFKTDSVSA